MPFPLLALAAAPSIIKGVSGLLSIGKGNRMARKNIRPVETVNPLIAQNNAIAENDALVGLPQEQYNISNQGIQRNLSGAIRTLGRSANPSAGLASVLRASNDATLNLGAQDAQTRMQNRRFAFGTRSALANEQNRVFDWNQRRKFQENAQAAAETINAGRQNAFGSVSDLSQLGQAFLGEQDGGSTAPTEPQPQDWRGAYGRVKKWSNRGY